MSAVARIEIAAVTDLAVQENLQRHAHAARGAFAHNTERALRSDVAVYTAWCSDTGRAPLPASPDTITAFIDAMVTQKAPATVRRYVSSGSTFHRAAGVQNPCEALAVKLALKRLHREKGRTQQQAAPVNDVLVARMLAVPGATLRHLRNRALVAVAYSTLCRRAELVTLQREDLQVDGDGFGTVTIRRSKTDQEGDGAVALIAPHATRHLARWIEAGRIETGPLFRSVLKGGRVANALGEGDIPRIYKAMAMAAGLTGNEIVGISGHSTRVGAAQDMVRYGVDLTGAMQAGRWSTPTMVARYSARLVAKRGGMAQITERRAQF